MSPLEQTGRLLLLFGGVLLALGLLLVLAGKAQFPFPGRLPGDILIQKGRFTFYFPIVTMLLVSVGLSLLLTLLFRLFR